MAIPSWPALLPQTPYVKGYEEEHKGQFQIMTSGNKAPLVRRVTSLQFQTLNCTLILNKTERALFLSFFNETLKGGTLRFSWKHPITKEAIECSFYASSQDETVITLSENDMYGLYWTATFKLYIWP